MKNLFVILTAVFAVTSAFAQTPTIPPGGVGMVTPVPTATPTRTTQATQYEWKKYSINLALVNAIGSGATGSITLDTLPAGGVVREVIIKPTAALTGPSATTGTLTPATATGTLASAYTVIGITPGVTVFNYTQTPTAANAVVWASGVLKVNVATDTTGGMAAVTACAADIYVLWAPLPIAGF